jgi:hypothetical protein
MLIFGQNFAWKFLFFLIFVDTTLFFLLSVSACVFSFSVGVAESDGACYNRFFGYYSVEFFISLIIITNISILYLAKYNFYKPLYFFVALIVSIFIHLYIFLR